jgi:transposase-like protein
MSLGFVRWVCPKCGFRRSSDRQSTLDAMIKVHKEIECKGKK